MTLTEAAALLHLAPATLRSSIHRGSLKARKVGRDWHVTPREVERYRAENLGRRGRPLKDAAERMDRAIGGVG